MSNSRLTGVGFLIIALAVAYYFVYYIPQRDKAAQDLQAESRAQLQICLTNASINEVKSWNNQCNILGLDESCQLQANYVNFLTESYNSSKDTCYKQYPQ